MLNILLVDDDDLLRKMLRLMIEKMGHQVIEAHSGEQALMLFRQKQPDVVVCDMVLPGADGVEIIRELKRQNPAVKVIAISGAGAITTTNYLEVAKAQGADAVLTKPFANQAFQAALERVTGVSGAGAAASADKG